MKHQVANAVAGFIRPPPDLFLGQLLNTGAQPWPIFFQQLSAASFLRSKNDAESKDLCT
jgi:hypothetical protein